MEDRNIFSQFNLESEAVAVGIVVLAAILIVFVNRKPLAVKLAQWRIQRHLSQIGSEQIRNLVCPDGLDGYHIVDRLALTADAILVIFYKPYGGNIYCAEHISEWTQVIGQKSFKFENPLFELENQLTSLRLLVGNVPLIGYLFFDQSAKFPKGHPVSVLHPDNLPQRFLCTDSTPVKAKIQAAWNLLKTRQQDTSAADRLGVKT